MGSIALQSVEFDGEDSLSGSLLANPKPLVSVVVASYNMGKYLPGAIDSILAQSYRNFEIIIVDDGSTDDTQQRLATYAERPNIRILRQENRGQPRAKNAGIAQCRGALIAFCDADDLWTPNKLEVQVPCFHGRPSLAVVSTEIGQIDGDGNRLSDRRMPRYSGRILEKLLIKNCISFGTAIVRKDALDDVGWFDESLPMGIDWDLWLRMAVKYEFLHIEEVTYLYRVWAGQMSRNHRGRYENAFRILDKFFSLHPDEVSAKVRRRAYADTYVGRGRIVFEREGRILAPLQDIFVAIRLSPGNVFAWKSLLKLAVRRR
jgi:glycosyltransferase involved in cell wall biosynthesis